MLETKRKGARTTKDIPIDILKQLNSGELESANMVEWFAVDRIVLLKNVLLGHHREDYLEVILEHVNGLEKKTANTINEAIGVGLFKVMDKYNDIELLNIIKAYKSDIVRSWGAFIIGKSSQLSLEEKFNEIQVFAKDRHFNVREEAWVALRIDVINNLDKSIQILSHWVLSDNQNIRRFASEVTRPRGVWCKHIQILKEQPELALSILDPLKSDESQYVRDSVGNWLNDASKTQSKFVINLCQCWEDESQTSETKYIIKKAMRTLNKDK